MFQAPETSIALWRVLGFRAQCWTDFGMRKVYNLKFRTFILRTEFVQGTVYYHMSFFFRTLFFFFFVRGLYFGLRAQQGLRP